MYWLTFLWGWGCNSCQSTQLAPTKPPNILLVVLDTVRADSLQVYGNKRPVGSNTLLLAQEGVVFEQAWSSGPWTWPSHASLFTGLLPWEHGAHFTEPSQNAIALKPDPFWASGLHKDVPTLAEELKRKGYVSYAISANRLIGPSYGLTRGFDKSEFIPYDGNVAKRAIDIIQEDREEPLFLFVNLMSAHAPYFWNDVPWVRPHRDKVDPKSAPKWLKDHLIPDEFGIHLWLPNRAASLVFKHISQKKPIKDHEMIIIKDLYEGEVALADHFYGEIQRAWDSRFQRSESLVALTSDHGEYFGEHGQLEHGRTVYPEVLHVPLIMRGPGIDAGKRIDTPVSSHWVHGDLLSAAGISSEKSVFNPSDSVWAGAWSDIYWKNALGSPFDQDFRALRKGDSIYILNKSGQCQTNEDGLFQVTENCPHRLEMERTFTEAKTGMTVKPSEEELQQLKDLGYIGED